MQVRYAFKEAGRVDRRAAQQRVFPAQRIIARSLPRCDLERGVWVDVARRHAVAMDALGAFSFTFSHLFD